MKKEVTNIFPAVWMGSVCGLEWDINFNFNTTHISFPILQRYRVYSCSKHPNRIHVDLLRCKFAFHNEIGQKRYSCSVKDAN